MTNPLSVIRTVGQAEPITCITTDVLANRPTADGTKGFYYASDTSTLYYDINPTIGWVAVGTSPLTPNWFNVKRYGAVGDGVTDDSVALQNAANAAIVAHGVLYIPSGTYAQKTAGIVVQDANGLTIIGDGQNASVLVGYPSVTTINVFSNIGSGSVGDIIIRGLKITASGAGAIGLRIWNCLHFSVYDLYISGDTALTIQGSGNGFVQNIQAYGNTAALNIGNGSGTLTNSGPIAFSSGLYNTNAATGPALIVSGDPVSIVFYGTMFSSTGGTQTATAIIDGTASPPTGDLSFVDCHGESNYNTTNTGVDFLIGNTTKFGSVRFYGGIYFGHGNGTNYQDRWLKIVRAARIVVDNVMVSKLGGTNGYNNGMVRLETTFPAPGDSYDFRTLSKGNITGSTYSDANSVIPTTYDDDVKNTPISETGQPRSDATNSAVQSIPTATHTSITFDTNTTNIGSVHSTSSNTSRFTVPAGQTGWWNASGGVEFASGAGTIRVVRILKNGATLLALQVFSVIGGGNTMPILVGWQGNLVATDYIEFQGYQDTGGNLNTVAGVGHTFGSVVKVL